MALQAQLPPINTDSVHIETRTVEEYYGINVTFAWETPIVTEEAQRLQTSVQQEWQAVSDTLNRRYEANRRRRPSPLPRIERGDFTPQGLVMVLLTVIRGSAEWAAFYADEERRTIYAHQLDGSGETFGDFGIPVFDDEAALLQITLTTSGGEVEFHTRDT